MPAAPSSPTSVSPTPLRPSLADVDVVLPNLNSRYSGVTSTIVALLPHHVRRLRVAGLGPHLGDDTPRIGWADILRHGWTRPRSGRAMRVWHARRNIEMVWGVVLGRLLRQPWRLVFTSAAQRRHTAFTRWLLRRMDAVIATSPGAASWLKVPATVSLHGVDTDVWHPAADRDRAWAELGLPGRFGVGIFGRIRPQKGTDLFVRALVDLLPTRPDWTGVVIGRCKTEDAAFLARLKGELEIAGLADRVVFLGELPLDEVRHIMRALAVVVAPPRTEGFGLLPLEAQASGVPIVASRAGAHEALIDDGRTGLLVPADDGDALTAALAAVMDLAPPARLAMGRAGRARVEADFSIEREAARIEAIYAGLWRR